MIYFPERSLAPKGGPAGYLYNLKNGLQHVKHDDLKISFYLSAPVQFEENQSIRNNVPKRIKDIRRAFKYANYLKKSIPVDKSLLEYDAIHFHKTEDMYLNRGLLNQYNGKVILTSHTPCVPYKEIVERLNPKDYKFFKNKIDSLVEMDRYAFERADYIIFPCEEAEEPYYNTWGQYASIKQHNKYKYLPTGIVACAAKETRSEYRKNLGIPDEAFVVSYAGRHNEIKGYGDLKKIGKKILKDENTYFLIAGREGPMYRLEHERWIEVGWTSDPHSLIGASDVFLLPNHETYFDLILLEVISLGIPVVMSKTGGNKYFEKFNCKGLTLYEGIDDACIKINEFKEMNISVRYNLQNDVKDIFNRNFTLDIFASNYIETLKSILFKEKRVE